MSLRKPLRGLKAWATGVLIGVDQLANSLCFGFPDETLSSRLGRGRKRGTTTGKVGCEVLDAIEKNHCSASIEETPDGQTDPHHLGKVIREIPR